jgi:hypothetical protein
MGSTPVSRFVENLSVRTSAAPSAFTPTALQLRPCSESRAIELAVPSAFTPTALEPSAQGRSRRVPTPWVIATRLPINPEGVRETGPRKPAQRNLRIPHLRTLHSASGAG